MQPSVPLSVLQGVHNLLTDTVKEVANEPSVGLYFVQQHVHKAVPGLLSLKSQLVEGTQEALLYTEDVKDALASVKTMKEVGPPVVNKMIASLNASLQLLPTLHHPKLSSRPPAAYTHLSRSATHHGAMAFSGPQPGTKATPAFGNSIQEAPGNLSTARGLEALPPRSPRSSPSQANVQPPSSTQTDSSGYVSSFLNSAYQKASSVRMSMPGNFEVKDRGPAPELNTSDGADATHPSNPTTGQILTAESNAGQSPNKSYWSVFESAIQKAGHMVGAGNLGSGGLSTSSREPTLVRSHSAASLRESSHGSPTGQVREVFDPAVSRAGSAVRREGSSPHSDGGKQAHEGQGRSMPDSIEGQVKLADWLKVPSTALRKLSRRDAADASHDEDQLSLEEREGLEEEEAPGLDLEDPEVLESYAKLQAEQAAKLEAWLGGDAEEKEPTLPS